MNYDLLPMTQRLRVLYVDHCAQLSGAEVALSRLVPELRTVAPTAILAEEGPLLGRLRDASVPVEVLPLAERSRSLRRGAVTPSLAAIVGAGDAATYAWRLSRRALAQRAQLIVTNSLKAHVLGGVAGRLANIPVLWHLHDRIESDYLPPFAVQLVRALARILPNGVVANSHTTLATLRLRDSLRDADKYAVIGNACHRPARDPAKPRPARSQLTVGMIARLAPWKGQHVFLEAFARAFPSGNARARIVGGALFGEDDYAAHIRALASALGIADRVTFLGHQDDIAHELDALDVLVHASTIPEPFGNVIIEAMAANVPVVAADAGGPAELVVQGVNGLLHPPGDADALATHLQQLARDPALRSRLSTEGRRVAMSFSPERIAAQMECLYWIVAGRSQPSTRGDPPPASVPDAFR